MDTEEEAEKLLAFACPLNHNNEYVAPELTEEQTLENLHAFGDRLEKFHKLMKKKSKTL